MRVVGNCAYSRAAFRDAAMEAGAVEQLVQVRVRALGGMACSAHGFCGPMFAVRLAEAVHWLDSPVGAASQYFAHDDLTSVAAHTGAWTACLLVATKPYPHVEEVRQHA